MRRNLLFLLLPAVVALLFALPSPARAEWPPQPKNLQVLPETIDTRQLIGIMRGFTSSLGVRCQFCHVGEEGQPLSEFDFASDTKSHKRTARTMMRMTQAINEQWIESIDDEEDSDSDALGDEPVPASADGDSDSDSDSDHAGLIKVQCETCHRGQKYPELIDDLMARTLATDGADAAIARYRELRDEYYGRHSFDFGAAPLARLAEQLAVSGDLASARSVIDLNLEYFPDDGRAHHLRGEILMRQDDREAALAAFRQALEIDPSNARAQQRIEELTAADEPEADAEDGGAER